MAYDDSNYTILTVFFSFFLFFFFTDLMYNFDTETHLGGKEFPCWKEVVTRSRFSNFTESES